MDGRDDEAQAQTHEGRLAHSALARPRLSGSAICAADNNRVSNPWLNLGGDISGEELTIN